MVTGAHDVSLVVLAVLIAIAASYTALDLASRMGGASSRLSAFAWLATAAICLGGGIWAMHFVAMLAYVIPGMDVAYDPWLTAISLMIAIAVTGVGFAVAARAETGPRALVLSGLFMGGGILAMHYVGMSAMLMHGTLRYDPIWVALSVFIAIGASIAALWLAFRGAGFVEKAVSALAMGLAISGMHFAGMRAAIFEAHGGMDPAVSGTVNQGNLAMAVSAITFLILLAAIVAAIFDRRFAALATQEAMALKQSEEQFRSLYRRTPLPLHALDAEGRIEDVSDAWLELLGYERASVIGRRLINFMTEESARQRIQDWKKLLADGELRDREYRLVSKIGEFIDVLSTSRVERDENGTFIWAVSGLVDVTARKQAEEALRQAQKMEAVGQLTGGIAHDFNNVLAVILGNLEMIRKRAPEGGRIIRLVDNATEGAKRGALLTQRMLSFARRQSLNPQSLDIRVLFEGMHDLLERSLGPQISLITRFADTLPLVYADPHQLEMALLNLVVNARDAMDNGTITISAEGLPHPRHLAAGPYICIAVRDEGEGMDDATLMRAREPFFTTKGVGRGTGLGLSMVSGFAEQSGGALVIDSRKGGGTTVEIWLPVAMGGKQAEDEFTPNTVVSDHETLLRGRTVLVVDDEALVLLSTESMLQEFGVKTLSAGSAIEALDLLERHPEISCVVTDYAMPGMTGAQLAAAIRVKKPSLPIAIATGYAELPDEIAAYRTLQKPFSETALANVVSEIISLSERSVLPFEREKR